MAKKTAFGSTKRFGPRYGRRNKDKVASLEIQHRGKHKCPFCNYQQVKRLSIGIWECGKCGEKFAGKAYTFEAAKKKPKPVAKEEPQEMPEEEILEEEDFEDSEEDEGSEEEAEDNEETPAEAEVAEEPVEVPEDAPEEERKEAEQAEVA